MSNLIKLKQIKDGPQLQTDVTNLKEAVKSEVYTVTSDSTDITELSAGIVAKAGDMLVVTNSNDVKSAYVYAYVEDKLTWVACTGKVDASAVIVNTPITLAGDYDSVGNVKLTDNTIAKGSVTDILTSIFTKELYENLKTGDPTASISSFTEYYEVGSTGTKSVTVSLNEDGSYAYGYSLDPTEPEAGATVTSTKNDGSTGVVVDTSKEAPYSVTFNGSTQKAATATFTLEPPVKTANAQLTATGTVDYTQGGVPVSNLKKAYPDQRIPAGTATSGASSVFRWYVPYYHGFIYGKDNKLSAVDVSKLTKATKSDAYVSSGTAPTKKTTATATGSWMQYWLVVPTSYKWTMKEAKDKNNLTLSVSTADNIKITYGSGDNAVEIEYNVYYIDNADPYDEKTISWSL